MSIVLASASGNSIANGSTNCSAGADAPHITLIMRAEQLPASGADGASAEGSRRCQPEWRPFCGATFGNPLGEPRCDYLARVQFCTVQVTAKSNSTCQRATSERSR